MKKIATATILAIFLSCPTIACGQQPAAPTAAAKFKPTYSPGLGEFMLQAQMRHLKLWLAGDVGNWDLATTKSTN